MFDRPPLRRPNVRAELTEAVDRARHSRHHPDCRCGNYQTLWCTSDEKLYCTAVDKLITQVLKDR